MKKENFPKTKSDPDELKPHYDFDYSKAKPNRFAKAQNGQRHDNRKGHYVTIHKSDGTTVVRRITPTADAIFLDSDVRRYFPDSESVNNALRGLIALAPQKARRKMKASAAK